MKAARVDERYLMFVISNNEEAIEEKVEELCKAIIQEYFLAGQGLFGD